MSKNQVSVEAIAELVPHNSHVLDLGCGQGQLLAYLQEHKNCTGYGVEIKDENVLACVQAGVQVMQLDLDEGLDIFADSSFDVVLQIDTLQHLHNAETMLRETVRVGKQGIIAFPNFAYWKNRLSVMRGRMPVNARMPYEWYNTPNIRVGTYADFGVLASRNSLRVLDRFGLDSTGHIVHTMPNFFATTAVYQVAR